MGSNTVEFENPDVLLQQGASESALVQANSDQPSGKLDLLVDS